MTMANSVQSISALKMSSTDKMVMESNKILYKILKSPYNHYSRKLEESEIERIRLETFNYGESVQDYVPFQLKESSKLKYDLISDRWEAEDKSDDKLPFGVHQIHEEIVAPIVQNLMNETRIERLKIYNHIKDQKISYLNKWHQDTEDFYGRNRAESADLVNLMRASLRDYIAAFNTLASLKKTEESMSKSGGSLDATVVETDESGLDTLAVFELQSKDFQDVQADFENFMEQLKVDIDYKAEKFEHIDYYDALLRDGNSKDIAVAASEVHEFEDRRKALVSVNPLFAKNSEIPPVPSIEALTHEHFSLNLPAIAKSSLNELENEMLAINNPTNELENETNIVESISNEDLIIENIEETSKTDYNTDSFNTEIDNQDLDNSDNDQNDDNNDSDDEDDLFDDQNDDEPIVDGPSGAVLLPEIDENVSSKPEINNEVADVNKEISNVLNNFTEDQKDFIVDQAIDQGKDLAKEQISSAVPLPPEMTGKAVDFLANKGKGFFKSKISGKDKSNDSDSNNDSSSDSQPKDEKPNDLKSKFTGLLDKKSDIKKKFGF